MSPPNRFYSRILLDTDKALIVGHFNIQVENYKDPLGLAFQDFLNSGPTHYRNHTMDLILSLWYNCE